MWFNRMELEVWFDKYQYEIEYDIGESAVKTVILQDLNIDLSDIPLRYGHHRGRPDLREKIASFHPDLKPDQVIVTTGASEANFILVSALVKPGDHVIIEHPNYPSLYEVPRSLGCEVELFTLRFDNHFKPDLQELEKKITPQTKLLSLTHPNNPTGSQITQTELQKLIELAEKHNIHLMLDETYRYMAWGKDLLPAAASLSEKAISISSMSKCYGLPGIRTGWLASKDQSVLDAGLAIREQLSIANNALSEEIAARVLDQREDYLQKARDRIEKNRTIVADWMDRQQDFEWILPEAGVVCLPRIRSHVQVAPESLFKLLAEKYKTFVVPGRCFEMAENYFRIGFGADHHEIETGLSNLNTCLQEVAAK